MNEHRIKIFKIALEQTKRKLAEFPEIFTLESVVTQLYYLIEAEEKNNIDILKLKSIIIGRIVIQDLDNVDDELAQALYKVCAEISLMIKEYETFNCPKINGRKK